MEHTTQVCRGERF